MNNKVAILFGWGWSHDKPHKETGFSIVPVIAGEDEAQKYFAMARTKLANTIGLEPNLLDFSPFAYNVDLSLVEGSRYRKNELRLD